MTNKHTPGPWRRNIKPASKYPTVFAGRNNHVAVVDTVSKTEDEIEANTNLIMAAPEILEALEQILVLCRQPGYGQPKLGAIITCATGAIQKARGGQ